MAVKRLEALFLILVFVNSASISFATAASSSANHHQPTYELIPPMPQFSSEAAELNYTIPYPVPKPAPLSGTITVLVIAVEFKDYNHTLGIDDIANQTITQLDTYFSRVSYGSVSVVGRAVGWIKLPYAMSDYGMDNGPFVDDLDGDGYPDSWRLLRDSMVAVAKEVSLSDYQHIVVLHAGYGQESSKNQNDIWSVSFLQWKVETSSGTVDHFAVVPEFEARGLGVAGVYTHEFAHLLGLPDLYSNVTEEVGPWDLMARGAWNGKPPGTSPAEMIAWNRIFLGWIQPNQLLNVTRQKKVNATVDPIELPSSGLHAIKIQTSSQDWEHYYLVEVREQIGFDSALPSSGVLITYIDETKSTPVKVIDAVQTTSTLEDAPFQPGQKYVDSEKSLVISVGNETNGSSYSVLVDTTSPSVDVLVRSLTVSPETVHPNDTASVIVVIANEGTLKTKTFLVALYLNDTVFVSRQMSLDVGETQEIQTTWNPQETGVYVFKAVADSNNQLQEASKDNNSKVLTIVVGYTLTLEMRPPGAGEDIQWWLMINGANQTFVGVGEFQIRVVPGINTLQIPPIISIGPDSRCVFRQWSDGSVSNPRSIQVVHDISLSADFSMQFLLSLDPNGGSTSAGGWYASGSSAAISANTPLTVVNKESRVLFVKWSGDVESSSPSLVLNMTRPYHVVANWKNQYYLFVESPFRASGEGWYDANTQALVSLSSTLTSENGTRHVFVQWSGDLLGAGPSATVTMSGPKYVSAVWKEQYELKIKSEYDHTNGAGWFDPGSHAIFVVDTQIIDLGNGTRRVFGGWSGDAIGIDPQGVVVMDGSKSIQANWNTQYLVTFKVQGLRNGTALTIVVDGKSYPLKASQAVTLWHDAGLPVVFSSNSTVTEAYRRYVVDAWRNSTGSNVASPQNILEPETYTVTYKAGSMSPCIIATATFGSELIPEVQFLRNFRDRLVLSTQAGSAFMNAFNLWYYSFSPQVANFIASHDVTRSPVRLGLYPLIDILRVASATYSMLAFSPEFAIVAAGIIASALIGLIYLTPVDLYLVRVLTRKKIGGSSIAKVSCVSTLSALVIILLAEIVNSSALLAAGSSALVLTVLISAPILFSFLLTGIGERLAPVIKRNRTSSRLVRP